VLIFHVKGCRMLNHPLHELLAIEILGSDAAYIIMRMEVLKTNYYVYQENYSQFEKYLQELQDDRISGAVWVTGKEDLLAVKIREVIRLFHNYVAGVKSFVDHSRNLVKLNYSNSPFFSEYQAEVDERFSRNPLAGFVEELRNYILHYQHPFSIVKIMTEYAGDLGKNPSSHIVYLYRDDLLQWDKWTKKGKSFLDNAPAKIGLLTEIANYHQGVQAFYLWLFEKLRELHKEEISWYEYMTKQFLLLHQMSVKK
jgi:hypothetical protein